MAAPRRAILGFALVGAGFGLWALKAASLGEPVFLWTNALRFAAGLAAAAGLLAMARGRSTLAFRAGVLGLFAAATVVLLYNVTSAITLPDDLSTLFGFAGAAAALYGAVHWTEPQGDALAAWWVGAGAALMACNPGLYVLLGLVRGDPWSGGWMPGSVAALAGFVLVAAGIRGAVGDGDAGGGPPRPPARQGVRRWRG